MSTKMSAVYVRLLLETFYFKKVGVAKILQHCL